MPGPFFTFTDRAVATATLVLALLTSMAAGAERPAHYRLKATWHETLLASLEVLAASDLDDGLEAVETETMRGGQPPQFLTVHLNGARDLYLFVTGCPDQKWAVANWAEPHLIHADGVAETLMASNNFRVLRGRYEQNLTLRAGLYQKMAMGQRVYDRGLNVQADSVIYVPLDEGCERFEAWVGVDNWAGTNGAVRFSVLGARAAARKRLFEFLAADFSDGLSRRQMSWEREDRIFEFDWQAGDWRTLARRYADASRRVPPLHSKAQELAASTTCLAELCEVREFYLRSRTLDEALNKARGFEVTALRAAIHDLEQSYPGDYPLQYRARFKHLAAELRQALSQFSPAALSGFEQIAELEAEFAILKREALLANPLLEFERLLLVKRRPIGDARRADWEGYGYGEYLGMPRQSSWNYGTMPNVDRWTNEVAVLSPVHPEGVLTTLYQPDTTALVADVELHWSGQKLLFSKPDQNRNFQVCEIRADGTGFRQLTPSIHPDVHNYDPLYLPSGEIIYLSTAPLQGVPCNASVIVGMMYKMGPNGDRIRQLTFEQDHDYTPSVLNNGRVLYLRWDYTDTPHIWNRLLMSMNPDGTGQMEFYGGSSYWPNAIFFARPIPGHPSKFVGIVTGHHEGRVGEFFIFDPAQGRHEIAGVVQRIPRQGPPVEAKIEDKLTEHSWPKFLNPWPLNDKYFLVACKPEPSALWGIYLVDVFDNLVLLKEEEGFALLEPIPFQERPVPPTIQDRVQPADKEALVYIEDIYVGPGLQGVPRGTIQDLRVFTYQFGYQRLAGIDHRVGADGPWEAKRLLGTVPVEKDGSALFMVPSKMPLSLQPLDAQGQAVALMRSWLSAMPGESISCTGCHERQSTAPPSSEPRLALARPPSRLTPVPGPPRGFSFVHDVQPVLDKYCVGCHDGRSGQPVPDLRRDQGAYVVYQGGEIDGKTIRGVPKEELLGKYGAVFEPSYVALRQYVRVGGLESDLHVLPPMEFHADTSELIRMLRKGHHQVQLDPAAWKQLTTWIDLNAPCHGRWSDVTRIPGNQCQRRLELRTLYGGLVENWELEPELDSDYDWPTPIVPAPCTETAAAPRVAGWPMNTQAAKERQSASGAGAHVIDLGDGLTIEFVRVPAGAFVMGDPEGEPDERPAAAVTIDRPFWMAKYEISNEQFAKFAPSHDSRFEHRTSWIFSEEYLGWRLNHPRQPVVRVSWEEAVAFCQWLSRRSGANVLLPTEAQWEYACRAGTETDLSYGSTEDDFSRFGNMGDASLRRLADEGWRPKAPDLVPRDSRFNDGSLVTCDTGSYAPNAWGLHDMHGNVAEWTCSAYQPYSPGTAARDTASPGQQVVARGGSWRDRPKFCRSAYRYPYNSYQKVYNVGFRVVIED